MSERIVIVSPADTLAQQALKVVEREAMLSWVILFGGDRWHCVEHVAIAQEGDEIVGMASLIPTDEMGKGGPHIIGVWVKSVCRHQGIGTALLKVLVEKSLQEYGSVPTVIAVSMDGRRLIEAASRTIDFHGMSMGFAHLP